MIGQEHSSTNFDSTRQPSSVGFRILLGSALILGISAIATSVFLLTQVLPLNKKVTELAAQIQTKTSGSTEGIVALKKQISELDKAIQSQSFKLSKNDETIANVKNELSQLKKTQNGLKEELSQLRNTQNDRSLLQIGTEEPQDIGRGFLVTHLNAESTNNGVTLTGNIINAAYLQHTNVIFRITMAGQSKPLAINRIEPSGSYRFEVVFPDVPIAKANHCRIDYESSSVSFITGYSSY